MDMGLLIREGVEQDESRKNAERVGETVDELLPGIPDEIIIEHVAPKLPWRASQLLWQVSRAWQRAFQSRQIFNARVRAQSTQAYLVMNHEHVNDVRAIALYCVSDGSCYNLPPIPGLKEGMPWSCQCISLDRKLYVLGGSNEVHKDLASASARVYVLDLAGQGHWKQCASMKDKRGGFGCGVINGKIYVFGGVSNLKPVRRSEVYDPETNVWSPIAPMKIFGLNQTFGLNQMVTAVGEELFVHIGWWHAASHFAWSRDTASAEVYHPVKDEWRSVDQFTRRDIEAPLLMGGKLHKLTRRGIDVYDVSKNSWKHLQRFSFGMFGPRHSFRVELLAAVALNDELLATVRCWILRTASKPATVETCLIRAPLLGCENKEIVWERTQCPLSFNNVHMPFLSLVHL